MINEKILTKRIVNSKGKEIVLTFSTIDEWNAYRLGCAYKQSQIIDIINQLAEETIHESSSGIIQFANLIKEICCKEDEDFDVPTISPKFLNDVIDSLLLDYVPQDNNGWIPCSEELPPMPKENPLFENKHLELYLVSLNSSDYPWRAFWNGKFFTDGFSKVEPIAWLPLPAPYKEKEGTE